MVVSLWLWFCSLSRCSAYWYVSRLGFPSSAWYWSSRPVSFLYTDSRHSMNIPWPNLRQHSGVKTDQHNHLKDIRDTIILSGGRYGITYKQNKISTNWLVIDVLSQRHALYLRANRKCESDFLWCVGYRGEGASAIHIRSMLQASTGSWADSWGSYTQPGLPLVRSTSINSCRLVSHLTGSPNRMIAMATQEVNKIWGKHKMIDGSSMFHCLYFSVVILFLF